MKSERGTIHPEAIALLIRLTPSFKSGIELLEMNQLRSEYWQGIRDAVLMLDKMKNEGG